MIPIEETVFSRKRWIESKMLAYGFHKANKTYILEKPFLDGDFKTVLSVTPKGQVTGKVIDTITQDEYYQLRQETATGPYVNRVRSAYPCSRILQIPAAATSCLLHLRPTG